jgi:heavy metal translocating P-type ATPase
MRASWRVTAVPAFALLGISGGIVLRLSGAPDAAQVLWMAILIVSGLPVVWRTVNQATHGHFATDLVATLAILTAVLLGQPVAGLVIVLMQTGGEALERYAEGRASGAIQALIAAAPTMARRLRDGVTEDVRAEDVEVGDLLMLRPGELLACDAEVVDGHSELDVSRLTGEPVPFAAGPGAALMSGSANGQGVLTVRAVALAGASHYARIVELVRSAQASKAPLQRIADRYAVWFTPVTLVVCAAAYLLTRDWVRVLAVLVVATPCPLILATPIAILGGINRAARRNIIVRNGGALESMEHVQTAVFDKTGTLTIGRPEVSRVIAAPGFDETDVLRLAASVERGSSHVLAHTVIAAAEVRSLVIPLARHVREAPGQGIIGEADHHTVAVGARSFLGERYGVVPGEFDALEKGDTRLRAYVVIDGQAAGAIEYEDRLRPGLPALFADLERLGVRRTVLLSGDHTPNVEAVARAVGIREAYGDLLPEHKVRRVRELAAGGEKVLMVGDGTNDAPALGSASVGIALAAHGGGITAEAADVVILADDLGRLPEALRIAGRAMRIARQSIMLGLGLSAVAMVFAAAGVIPPIVGAVLQEAIDVVAILNALRAGSEGRGRRRVRAPCDARERSARRPAQCVIPPA